MSIARQYAAKLIGNVLAAGAGLVILSVVPRELGPNGFGRYEFLINFFQQIRRVFDSGVSAYFFTRLSQVPSDFHLVRLYRSYIIISMVVVFIASLTLVESSLANDIWPNEQKFTIILAIFYAGITWWLDSTRKLCDAYGLTVISEAYYAAVRVFASLILIGVIGLFGLSTDGYFVFLICSTMVTVFLIERKSSSFRDRNLPYSGKLNHIKECWRYSHPLLVYTLIVIATGISGRWLLQRYGGAIEQGYFGLAYQIAAVCFIFTSALTQLLTREFSAAWSKKDLKRVRMLFVRLVPVLYTVAGYFCIFVAFNAADVIWLVAGTSFGAGTSALVVAALYPMHQTYGQLSGSIFYASDNTKIYRNIGIVGALAELPIVFWLVSPFDYGGLGLGALGLAIVMVGMQFILVNVGLYFNARAVGLPLAKLLIHQLATPVLFLGCCYLAHTFSFVLADDRLNRIFFSGFVYTVLVILFILTLPAVAGLSREDITKFCKFVLFFNRN